MNSLEQTRSCSNLNERSVSTVTTVTVSDLKDLQVIDDHVSLLACQESPVWLSVDADRHSARADSAGDGPSRGGVFLKKLKNVMGRVESESLLR